MKTPPSLSQVGGEKQSYEKNYIKHFCLLMPYAGRVM